MKLEEIGRYDFTPMRRGDSFPEREIAKTEQPAGTPKAIASARMEVRSSQGDLVHFWDSEADPATITIGGAGNNSVVLAEVGPAVTSGFVPGEHNFDLEVFWVSGGNRTIVAGKFPVIIDITLPRPTP